MGSQVNLSRILPIWKLQLRDIFHNTVREELFQENLLQTKQLQEVIKMLQKAIPHFSKDQFLPLQQQLQLVVSLQLDLMSQKDNIRKEAQDELTKQNT